MCVCCGGTTIHLNLNRAYELRCEHDNEREEKRDSPSAQTPSRNGESLADDLFQATEDVSLGGRRESVCRVLVSSAWTAAARRGCSSAVRAPIDKGFHGRKQRSWKIVSGQIRKRDVAFAGGRCRMGLCTEERVVARRLGRRTVTEYSNGDKPLCCFVYTSAREERHPQVLVPARVAVTRRVAPPPGRCVESDQCPRRSVYEATWKRQSSTLPFWRNYALYRPVRKIRCCRCHCCTRIIQTL